MSIGYYLYCERTHQCVHVATTSGGCPTGTQAHHMAIQFFTVAHSDESIQVTTEIDEIDSDAIEWNVANCVELFCRLTGDGECIGKDMRAHIAKSISEDPERYPEYTGSNWLRNYTCEKGLEYFGLIHEFK